MRNTVSSDAEEDFVDKFQEVNGLFVQMIPSLCSAIHPRAISGLGLAARLRQQTKKGFIEEICYESDDNVKEVVQIIRKVTFCLVLLQFPPN